MKFSSKIEKCGLSPIRKFGPLANEAKAKGIKIYHLNIGQPDIETPKEMMEAIRATESVRVAVMVGAISIALFSAVVTFAFVSVVP